MLRTLLLAAGDAAVTLRYRRLAGRSLSLRQRQVLSGVARGQQTKEIAHELGISEATVKTHLARAAERLGATSRAQAVARYVSWSRSVR